MDQQNFSKWGKRMVDFICEYLSNIDAQPVVPTVDPGYLRPKLPEEAPEEPEEWEAILSDVKRLIVPGLTHWQHPGFHAYFPASNSAPSILGDMLSTAFGCNGFSWAASPAITELEVVMVDWVAKLMKLPQNFTHVSGIGGGVIQSSASDSILVTMLAARHQAVQRIRERFLDERDPDCAVLSRLVAYASTLAHSCVEKASMICFVKFRQIEPDHNYALQGDALKQAVEEDIKSGFIPFYVCATLGTTSCCSFDNLASLGPVCHLYNLWLHIDAAYAGSALICPEFQYLANGIEYACSINSNPNKWMLVGFDCSLMWVRDRQALTSSMAVDPIYLQHKHSSKAIDFRHWGIPLSRRFRSLKLWFVMRAYGASGLRSYIRNHVALARLFAQNIRTDDRFELVGDALLGLVCFRLKGSNALNQLLTRAINESLRLHVVPGVVKDLYFIRFAICRENATSVDVEKAWHWIKRLALEILAAKEALDSWYGRLSTRFKKPLELDDTSLENLYPSEHSDDEEQNEFEADQDSVHMSKLETELASFAKYRLDKLLEVGETEAHRTLLHYLQRLGWDTSRLLRRGDANSDGPQDSPCEVHNSLGTVPGSSEVKNGLDLISRIQNFTSQVHSKPCVRKTRRRTQSADFSGLFQKHDGHEFRGLMHRTQTFSSAIIHGEPRNPSPLRLSPSDNIPKSTWVTSHSFAVPEQIPSAIPLHWKVPELPHTACGTVHTGFRRLTSMRAFQNECDAQGPRISERDLGVGAIHTKTLTKLRRHSLIRMLADPICLDESGQTDCTSERYKDGNIASRSWRYKVMEFNRMLKSFEYAKSNEPNRSTI